MFFPGEYLDLTQTAHGLLFDPTQPVWSALGKIKSYVASELSPAFHGRKIGESFIGECVFIGEGTTIEAGAVIKGPAWIGKNCEIRTGAYLRENVIVGDDCVLGNSCEFKNAVLFNGCQVPHFSYVGDSILGHRVHLGAGVTLSNFKLAGDEVVVRREGKTFRTGLRKFGAILGDGTEIGCHSVLNPGSILGRGAMLYPGVVWRGILAAGARVKHRPVYEIISQQAAR